MRQTDLCHQIRQRLKRLPPPHQAHYGVVPLPPPEDAIDLAGAQAQVEAASAALAKIDTLAAELHDPYLISRVLARQEAVASSSIEGTHSTLDELLAVEETQDGAATDAARQVRDYAATLDAMVPEAQRAGPAVFTPDLLAELHRRVMRDDRDYQDVPGALRTRVVWIGGRDIAYSTFNPPPPEDVAACLDQAIDYMQARGMQVMTQGLLTRMAVAHAQFEAIHPFRDGNGRVGRLLLPLMMAADGHTPLYLSPYIEAQKGRYYDALKAAQQQRLWGEMVGFLAEAVSGTVDELMVTRKALTDLGQIWLARRKWRRKSSALRTLDLLPHYPVVTIRRLEAALGVSFKSAAAAVDQLTEAGILTERTGYAKNRIFAATEVLSLINRPFGAEPLLPGMGTNDQ